MSEDMISVGDVVRVRDPSRYLKTFANRISSRDAVVERIFTHVGSSRERVIVRFLKRNGRGVEFMETFYLTEVCKA